MHGLMMDMPLLIPALLEHGAQYHADTQIVSRTVEGPIHRTTLGETAARVRRLANALRTLGIEPGDRVGTLAWNGHRHMELYFAVSGIGAVTHTINPRLFPPQIAYIVNHAEDRLLFADLSFVPLLEGLADQLAGLRGIVLMTDRAHMPDTTLRNVMCFEELVAAGAERIDWPDLDERTASSLCYTSGTTGNPKGVLYSHRSTVLHTLSILQPDVMNIGARDCVMPVVPMFHVNAWGTPYAVPVIGCKFVLPGPKLDGASLHALIEGEGVTLALGVPTVWLGLLKHVEDSGGRFTTLKRTVIGGSAAPPAMIETFRDRHGVEVLHAWGMTEMSPIGTLNSLKHKHEALPSEERARMRLNQGRVVFGVAMRIVDGEGRELPRDGKAYGHLQVRGPWVASGYFKDGRTPAFTDDGWFDTGDVATLDPDGFMQITDRAKDVIKSGGEWISSIELENAAVAHPCVLEAAAIGVHHPKWDERPLLVVVRKPGAELSKDELLAFMADKVVRWWLPDDVQFVAELPHTATGKLSKLHLREQFKDYRLPDR